MSLNEANKKSVSNKWELVGAGDIGTLIIHCIDNCGSRFETRLNNLQNTID